jgi:hypothetical protein
MKKGLFSLSNKTISGLPKPHETSPFRLYKIYLRNQSLFAVYSLHFCKMVRNNTVYKTYCTSSSTTMFNILCEDVINNQICIYFI